MIRHWNFTEEVLNPSECNRLIGIGSALMGTMPNAEQAGKDHAYRAVWIDREHRDFAGVFHIMDRTVHESNRAYFALEVWPTHALQFTTYDADAGHFHGYHRDAALVSAAPSDNKISFALQLSASDDYEGGDLQMRGVTNYPDQAMVRQQGGAMSYASILQTAVAPVTKGVRHAILAWHPGPHWR